MPVYIDFHAKMPQLPPEMITQMQGSVGKPDALGVIPLAAYFTKDGQGYCVSQATSADAVCKDHASHGLALEPGDVHEIEARIG